MEKATWSLRFDRGTLVLDPPVGTDATVQALTLPEDWLYDKRTLQWRAPAHRYRSVILQLKSLSLPVEDQARQYEPLSLKLVTPLTPRPHQAAALKAWLGAERQGVVQMPTGSGKTYLAALAILATQRATLVVVPTIDLMHQWQRVLTRLFGTEIGELGGGSRNIKPITVSTYDSAALMIESLGSRFGLFIADECHHLPAPQNRTIALGSIAPFRLGLSATVERADGRESDVYRLMGELVYDASIHDMVDTVLSPYDVVSVQVDLTDAEAVAYKAARQTYTDFLRRFNISFARGGAWREFVAKAARLPGGRLAMRSYREQKRIAQASSGKLDVLWRLLHEHSQDRMIVFTDDNAMAYRIGRDFILPVLTHQTKASERRRMLDAFRSGELNVLVTSKVLNEGVDVPDANIGVVISGSGAVREHVQRLGRILRHRPGKRAVLYELLSRGTSELNVNQRRKQHHAYQGPAEIPS